VPVAATSPKYAPASEKELGRDTVGTQRLGCCIVKTKAQKTKTMRSNEFKRNDTF
jgi:hypothetical protein